MSYEWILAGTAGFIILLTYTWYELAYQLNRHRKGHPECYDRTEIALDIAKLPLDFSKKMQVQDAIPRGKQIAKESTLVIVGLVYNSARNLSHLIQQIEKTGSYFKKYNVVLFENYSKDGSRRLLKEWEARNKRVDLINCEHLGDKDCRLPVGCRVEAGALHSLGEARMHKMTTLRNQYMEHIHSVYADSCDFMLLLDMDIEGYFANDGLFHSLAQKDKYQWDMVAANGKSPLPVIGGWLGIPETMTYDGLAWANMGDPLTKGTINWAQLIWREFHLWYTMYTSPNYMIPCRSAFNGCAIYDMKKIRSSRQMYQYGYPCEHWSFHKNLICYLNRSWVGYVGIQGHF